MSDNPCVYTLIFMITVLSISWPIYGYFIFKWHQNRNHFVLRNRWPKISTAIIILTIIMQLLSLIDALWCMKHLAAISMGICNMISGLVFYRAQLVYLRCLATREYLAEYMASQNRSIHIKSTQSRVCCYIWTKMILFVSIASSLCMIFIKSGYLDIAQLIPLLFTLSMLIGIISLLNILYKKITDSIGISKECSVQISCMFIMLVFGPFLGTIVPPYIEINYWAGVIVVTLYGFVTLFIGLNLIQRNSSKFIKPANRPQLQTQASMPSMLAPPPINIPTDSISINTRSVGLSVIDKQPSTPHVLAALQLRNVSSETLRKSLQQFIKNDINNYSLFVGYLCECFALENLMFLERAIILYHAIVKYKKKDTKFQVGETNVRSPKLKKIYLKSCYKLPFKYLSQIHTDIDNMIRHPATEDMNPDNQSTNFMKYKAGIVQVMQVLYTQFCRYDSETEINISYEAQGNIRQLFENKTQQQILQQFKSYDDLLIVFHYAIAECWYMCQSVYGFQFKSYIRKNKQNRRLSVPGFDNLNRKITNDFECFPDTQQTTSTDLKKSHNCEITPMPHDHGQASPRNCIQDPEIDIVLNKQKTTSYTNSITIDIKVVTPQTPLLKDESEIDTAYQMTAIQTNKNA